MVDRRSAGGRVVYDASIWVSAFAYPASVPDQAIEVARAFDVQSVISEELIEQVRGALLGPRFRRSAADVRDAVQQIRDVSQIVVPTMRLAVITAKESDNRILECAVTASADLIVTGDRKHLLPLGSYRGIRIVSPADFLRSL